MVTLRRIHGAQVLTPSAGRSPAGPVTPCPGRLPFNAVGIHAFHAKRLAKPVGQVLYFAGEATDSQHFQTAWRLPGQRAAWEILAWLAWSTA